MSPENIYRWDGERSFKILFCQVWRYDHKNYEKENISQIKIKEKRVSPVKGNPRTCSPIANKIIQMALYVFKGGEL